MIYVFLILMWAANKFKRYNITNNAMLGVLVVSVIVLDINREDILNSPCSKKNSMQKQVAPRGRDTDTVSSKYSPVQFESKSSKAQIGNVGENLRINSRTNPKPYISVDGEFRSNQNHKFGEINLDNKEEHGRNGNIGAGGNVWFFLKNNSFMTGAGANLKGRAKLDY